MNYKELNELCSIDLYETVKKRRKQNSRSNLYYVERVISPKKNETGAVRYELLNYY